MRPAPEGCRHGERIDSLFSPPGTLIAGPVELTVVQPANRDGEPITDFPSHRSLLRELEVVGVGGGATADEARLGRNKLEVFTVALAHRFADHGDFFRTGLALAFVCFSIVWRQYRRWLAKVNEPHCKY